jgi:ferrochelatase
MRIDNLLQITDGILQNIPSVHEIESIKIDPLKIQRGDLFLDIKNSFNNQITALENGAYAIISENISQIIDNEIAWIEVDSLRLACVKLSRYEFNKKNGKIIYVDDIQEEILQSIVGHKEFTLLESNVYQSLVSIRQSGENNKFICSDERLAYSIDSTCTTIKECFNINILKSYSPFFSSFSSGDTFYNNIKIPNIFIKNLCSIVEYLKENKIEYNLNNLLFKKHFSPNFVDFGLNKIEFGQSSKVIILEKNIDLINLEARYLENFSNKLLICIPKRYTKYINIKNISIFSSEDELLSILNNPFRYALVLGEKLSFRNLFLPKSSKQMSLF